MTYRPWGPVGWVLSLSDRKNWHYVGAIGTTERSLCSWKVLKRNALIKTEQIARIVDVDSEKYRDLNRTAFDARLCEFVQLGGQQDLIHKFDLMDELFRVLNFAQLRAAISASVILDITAFPKRFFFPIIRTLVQSNNVKNLLITYTYPASYTEDILYEEIESWRALPGFAGTIGGGENWIVSMGFLVESLRQYVGDNPDHERMKLLIPYPAPLANMRRTWESAARLEGGQLESGEGEARFEKFRVDAFDMSSSFDRIVSLAGASKKPTAFAPFGPKPTSVAMCLYAIEKDSPVYYPQPTVYHPNYAIGIRENDPEKAVTAYWIKHEGENLYRV
jgi:hypothetical protein